MSFTRFTKNVLNVSALPDRVQNQAQTLKATFDQAGVDIKAALNALIAELEASTSADNIGADVQSVATKTVQAILTAFEEEIANRYTKTEAETLLAEGTNNLVADVDVNLTTGIITITKKDGTAETFDTAIEKVPAKFEIVESGDSFALKITNVDGTSTQTDITNFMNIYNFNNSDNITFEVTGEGTEKKVTANIKANSIGLDKLSLSLVSTLEGYMTSARDSANAAKTSETNARTSELNALEAESSAQKSAEDAEYWAKQAQAGGGGGGITEIPIASAETLGGIKVGGGLNITEEGVLSADVSEGANVSLGRAYFDYNVGSAPPTDTFLPLVNTSLNNIELDSDGNPILKAGKSYKIMLALYGCNITNDAANKMVVSMNHSDGTKSNVAFIYPPRAANAGGAGQNLTSYVGTETPTQDYSLQLWAIHATVADFVTTGCTRLAFGLLIEEIIDTAVFIAAGEATGIDTTPTEGSTNVVTSGGIKEYVDAKITYGTEDLVAGTTELATGKIYLCYE